ncbi:branched-chain amino acid aminotransferase [Sphingopyxis terrae]|uniref:branched-chain amino acid aminotransferase n=1 Tax=Sphingopyxis terrae TaxID=33052 RepID=UPI002A0F479E|nr:branched-chain amino acid aminotransferase [Sphingopyxis terrae]MDX8356501.1 branched-chain amino acid aminotransferase [Sphingopyxis terrae]
MAEDSSPSPASPLRARCTARQARTKPEIFLFRCSYRREKVNQSAPQTWTFIDGEWHEGNYLFAGARTHALWFGSSVFDGARWFEGVSPDLRPHCERVGRSAIAIGLQPTLGTDEIVERALEGVKKFTGGKPLYIRPSYFGEAGGLMTVSPDPASTRFALTLMETPMSPFEGFSITKSPFRRPTIDTMPVDAKAGCLYPNNGRAIREAHSRGFNNALMLDMLGNVAETATANIFAARGGQVFTPAVNGTFLNGITRQRIIGLMRGAGIDVQEMAMSVQDFIDADEIFTTGNLNKVTPVTRIEQVEKPIGPMARRARELYWEWAHAAPAA